MSTKDLFRITEGNAVYSFTSSNEDEALPSELLTESGQFLSAENGNLLINDSDEVFSSRVVGRNEYKDTNNFLKDTIELSFTLKDSIAQHFLQSPIDYVARIECYSINETSALTTEWRGTLSNVKPSGQQCKLEFNSLFATNRTAGSRPLYQRNCRHTLYGPFCRANFDDFKVSATVTAISSDGLTATCLEAEAFTNGYFNGGVFVMPDGTTRYIRNHVGSSLTLIRYSPSLIEAWNESLGYVDVTIAPGCSQSIATCIGVFANWLNYGGFLNIPLTNPNGSSIV